jgi:hypothetical protein
MVVRYTPTPEFQFPNVNFLGAMAQGEASRLQELQQEKLAQQLELQNKAAVYAANTDARAAEKEEQEKLNREFDLAAKYKDQFNTEVSKLNPRAPNFQAGYDALLQKYTPLAPTLMANVPKTHTPESWQSFISGHDDLMKQLSPTETETVVDGVRGKALFRTDPFTQQRTMVADSFVPAREKWSPVRSEKQTIEYYQNESGTKILTPEEYKAMATSQAQPIASRGQAGAFQTPVALTPPAAEPMNLVNQAKQGVAKVESGGNYGAIGPDVKRKSGAVDNAYGKYQVMGANIPSWTKQAIGRSLTPQEFLRDKDAQEAVFEDQFKRNIAKYGSLEDAVSVWFSGRPLAQAAKAGARDVNMGVSDYVSKVMAGSVGPYQANKTVPLTGERPSLRALPAEPINALAPSVAPVNAFAAPASVMPVVQPPVPSMAAAPEDTAVRQQKFIATAPLGQTAKYKSKVELENMLTNFGNEIEYLVEQGGVPSVKNTPAKNAEISAGSSWLGQAYGRFTGSPIQSTRDTVDSIRQNLVSVLARATGKTAQELNSNFDVKNAIKALGDPKATVESVRATLNNLNKTFGTNVDISGSSAKSESRRQIEAAKAAPSEAAGIPPAAIEELRANPGTAAMFDEYFGVPGLAAKILGR